MQKKGQFEYSVLIKKNVGNAVKRNYYKRIVREFIRKNINKFGTYKKIVFLYNYKGNINFRKLEKEFKKKIIF